MYYTLMGQKQVTESKQNRCHDKYMTHGESERTRAFTSEFGSPSWLFSKQMKELK